jgi:lipid-binding SYLF domain-containing protein
VRAHRSRVLIVAVLGLAAATPAARADDFLEGKRKDAEVIAKVKEKDPRMPKAFEDAYGYAVFPSVGKGGLGLGGAHGKGRVYERGKLVGRSSLMQLTLGLQLGGQAYSEVVFFKTKAAFADFKRGKLKLDAQATAVALDARAAADLAYRNGVAIVTIAKGGLMYEASIGGQKFSFHSLEEVD